MSELSVLQIAHDHPAFTSGGTEWIAHDLTRALGRRPGVRTRLVCASTALSRPDARPGERERLGADDLIRTGAYDAFSMARRDGTAWARSLDEILEDTRPDIVHFHGLDRLGVEALPFVRRKRPAARILLTLHDYQMICARDGLMVTSNGALCRSSASDDACHRCLPGIPVARHALRRAHLHAILDCVDLFLAPSAFAKARFVDWGIAPERIALMPNAVPKPRRRGSLRGNRFAFFGNIADHKGIHVLLDAAARLAAEAAPVEIRIHGGFTWGAEAQRARFEEALRKAAPIVHHCGPYAREDLPALMLQADWVVVPSTWWENAPLVILEAQAMARPVVCSGIGGMAELVADRRTGLHVPPGDVIALAETIRDAAADPALCRRLSANIAPPVSVTAFARAHLALYRDLLTGVPA